MIAHWVERSGPSKFILPVLASFPVWTLYLIWPSHTTWVERLLLFHTKVNLISHMYFSSSQSPFVASCHRLFGFLWYHHCCVYVLSVLHPYVYFGFVSMACHHSYISLILVFVSLSAPCLLYICCMSSLIKLYKLRDIASATTDTTSLW